MIIDSTIHQLISLTPKNASNPYTNQGQPEGVNNRAESVLLNHAAQFAPLQNAVSVRVLPPHMHC
jgi:hypothetical protein